MNLSASRLCVQVPICDCTCNLKLCTCQWPASDLQGEVGPYLDLHVVPGGNREDNAMFFDVTSVYPKVASHLPVVSMVLKDKYPEAAKWFAYWGKKGYRAVYEDTSTTGDKSYYCYTLVPEALK